MHREERDTRFSDLRHSVYLVALFLLTLTGFGQMPIFKRYYIADIPGLGWLDRFFVTHDIHYLTAVLFLFILSYQIALHLLAGRAKRTLTAAGSLRAGLLFGIIASGAFLVIRNRSGVWIPPGVIVFVDLMHLGLVMAFLAAALFCSIFKHPWTRRVPVGAKEHP